MIKTIFVTHLIAILFLSYSKGLGIVPEIKDHELALWEYGVHVPDEELSYFRSGSIPAFTQKFALNVTPTSPHLEKRFTYLKLEYSNAVSTVVVSFDPRTMVLTLIQKFPLLSVPFQIHGYSMPLPKTTRR